MKRLGAEFPASEARASEGRRSRRDPRCAGGRRRAARRARSPSARDATRARPTARFECGLVDAGEGGVAAAGRPVIVIVAVQQRIAACLGLVERAVPEQDVDRAVRPAGGPAVDQRPGAVALQRQRQQLVAELTARARAPTSAACAGCRPSAARSRRAAARAGGRAPRSGRRRPSRRARRRGPGRTSSRAAGRSRENTLSLISLKCVGVTPHSVHQTSTPSPARERRSDSRDVERQVAVGVRGEEVQRRAVCDDVVEEVRDPARRGGRGTADQQPRVDGLDRLAPRGRRGGSTRSRVPVQKTSRFASFQTSKPQLRDLVDAVALDEVRGERRRTARPTPPSRGAR